MPYGVSLLALRREFRAEAGISLNPLQGVAAQATIDILLARQQRELWDAYHWQHLHMFVDMVLSAAQSIYSYPAQMSFDQLDRVYVATSSNASWKQLTYGIPATAIPPSGIPPRGTPARWSHWITVSAAGVTNPIGQLAIHPAPNVDGMLMRLEGQAPLNELVADTDTCLLDSKLIVLFAAAEYMAIQKAEAAAMKLTKAQNYLRRLLQNENANKRGNVNMAGSYRYGVDPDRSRAVPYMDYIPS